MKSASGFVSSGLTRRGFIKAAGAVALAGGPLETLAKAAGVNKVEPFRFVHLADIHVDPARRAGEGFRACLAAVHDLKPRPDFILTGGDLVMDVLKADASRAKMLFNLYTAICKDSDIPIRQCMGNHDNFGWTPKGRVSPDHVGYGKKMARDALGLEKTTYSFDHKGWHFCVVDDVQPADESACWRAEVSEADLDWLNRDLAAVGNRPTAVAAHVPFVRVSAFRNQRVAKGETSLKVHQVSMCRNPGAILNLFDKHHVNLALTGHTHQNERIDYRGTTHIIEAAVCGAWWKGAHLGNPEGFGLFDMKADGTFTHSYRTYGWKAKTD